MAGPEGIGHRSVKADPHPAAGGLSVHEATLAKHHDLGLFASLQIIGNQL
jgi:hypothetical protein